MLRAAFTSACDLYPHARQRNCACVTRFPAAICPHCEHRCEVWRGAAPPTTPPPPFALARRTPRNNPPPPPGIDLFRPALSAAPLRSHLASAAAPGVGRRV